MSWLSRSIANSLCLNDEEDDALEEDDHVLPQATEDDDVPPEDRSRESAVSAVDRQLSDSDGADSNSNHRGDEHLDYDSIQGRSVKEDLSELKDSLTRQFWGAASFLAPPPPPPPPLPLLSHSSNTLHIESKSGGAGLNNDNVGEGEELMEYEERESGECGELANCSLSEDYYENIIEDAVGITEEVLAFAMNIVHHPETWLDFPLSEEDDFDVKGFGSHSAFAILVLLILAKVTSLCQNVWTLANLRKSVATFAAKLLSHLHSRNFSMTTADIFGQQLIYLADIFLKINVPSSALCSVYSSAPSHHVFDLLIYLI